MLAALPLMSPTIALVTSRSVNQPLVTRVPVAPSEPTPVMLLPLISIAPVIVPPVRGRPAPPASKAIQEVPLW